MRALAAVDLPGKPPPASKTDEKGSNFERGSNFDRKPVSDKEPKAVVAARSTDCIHLGVPNANPDPIDAARPSPVLRLCPTPTPSGGETSGPAHTPETPNGGSKTPTEGNNKTDSSQNEKDNTKPYKYGSKMWEELDSLEMYHGVMPPDDASTILTKQGDYIIRKLEDRIEPVLAVTVRWDNDLYHFPFYATEINGTTMYLLTPGKIFPSPHEVIRYHQAYIVPVYQAIQLISPIPKQAWELSRSNVSMDLKIGEGAFGEVWKGNLTIRKPNENIVLPVAVKVMKLEPMKATQNSQLRKFQEEARMMRQLNHRNVVKLHGILFSEVDIMIVMELINNGGLDNFLKEHKELSILTRASYSYDVAAGLAYLHSQNWMHRDVAARNCLVNEGGKIIKLSDFGMAAQGTRHQIPKEERVPIRWQAPEVIYHRIYVRQSDIWSYGMLVYEIHTCKAPFNGVSTAVIKEKLLNATFRPPVTFNAKAEVLSIIEKCWLVDTTKRPAMASIAELLKQYCIHSILPIVNGKLINQSGEVKKKLAAVAAAKLRANGAVISRKGTEKRQEKSKSGNPKSSNRKSQSRMIRSPKPNPRALGSVSTKNSVMNDRNLKGGRPSNNRSRSTKRGSKEAP